MNNRLRKAHQGLQDRRGTSDDSKHIRCFNTVEITRCFNIARPSGASIQLMSPMHTCLGRTTYFISSLQPQLWDFHESVIFYRSILSSTASQGYFPEPQLMIQALLRLRNAVCVVKYGVINVGFRSILFQDLLTNLFQPRMEALGLATNWNPLWSRFKML